MKDILLINFISGGGIKQFTNYLLSELKSSGVNVIYKETRSIKELVKLCKAHEDVVFCVNNIRIYILFFLIPGFSPTLILHDHKIRKGASLVEKILIWCVNLLSYKFKKIIIHSFDEELLKKPNVVISKMPFHSPGFSTSDKVKILYFGRIEAYKNIPYLVDIAINTQNSTEYIIAGSGEIDDFVLSKINKASNVSLINAYLDENLIKLLFEWCDYLILPYSDITQTGLVDISGFFSKPVVLSEIPGFNDYLNMEFTVGIGLNKLDTAIETVSNLPFRNDNKYLRMKELSYKNYIESKSSWGDYIMKIV